MREWLVCPHHQFRRRILTPFRTQAAVAPTRQAAIEKAEHILAEEGGGAQIATLDADGRVSERREVPPTHRISATLTHSSATHTAGQPTE